METKKMTLVRCLKCGKILECSRNDTYVLIQHIRNDHPEVKFVDVDRSVEIKKKSSPKYPNKSEHLGKGLTSSNEKERGKDNQIRDNNSSRNKAEEVVGPEKLSANENLTRKANDAPQYITEDELTKLSLKSEILEKYPQIKDCEFCPRDNNANILYTRRYKIRTPSSTSSPNSVTRKTPRKRQLYRTSIEKWRPLNGTIYCPKCGCNKPPLIEARNEFITENSWCAFCLLNCWPLCFIPWIFPSHEVEHLHCSKCKTFLVEYEKHVNINYPEEEKSNNVLKKNKSTLQENGTSPNPPSSNRLPSIVIDGKELHPDMVARLQRFKKFGPLAGIDLEALTDDSNKEATDRDSYRNILNKRGEPSVGNDAH
ncbi:uncharacterized protein isoform X2 [Musca autumnalis]|uniref:uncharacterized protein isoform X2 n=1 Tax=Musca autumnalis TaxID=221902 RepID=UPI003CF0E304